MRSSNATYRPLSGTIILHHIAITRFNEPGIDQLNKTLFALASYNAGPNRIARPRTRARQEGLDPNTWFGNVELEVAKDAGQETGTSLLSVRGNTEPQIPGPNELTLGLPSTPAVSNREGE